MQIKKFNFCFQFFLIFSPLLIYLGKKSFLAYDEGIYILQSKWILNLNNWIAPMWWGEVSLDRTIAIQALIGFSQKIFGNSNFSIYIPNIIFSFLMLFLTYKLHEEIIDKKNSIASPLILATTYLWINYSHQASQDIIYSFLILFGIFSTIKYIKTKKYYFLISSGAWIGLAFMFKTYLSIIPLLALIPILINKKLFYKWLFWIGIILGFIPFIIWSIKVCDTYGLATYYGIFNKVIALSEKNTFSNPFYYYFWNIPVNIFPWTFFSLVGFLISYKNKNYIERYFLFIYPIVIIFLISCFSTKTPYYSLQLTPLIALNSYVGLTFLIKNNGIYTYLINSLNFVCLPSILIVATLFINSNLSNLNLSSNDKFIISSGTLIFSMSWILTNFFKAKKSKFLLSLLGPYLIIAILVQSGSLSDRNKELRIASEKIIDKEVLYDKQVEVLKGNISSNFSHSKIIKISLLMPNIGNGINNLEELKLDEYVWTRESTIKDKAKINYEIIDDSNIFKPWILVKRKK